MLSSIFGRAHAKFAQYSDTALTFALLGVAVAVIIIALTGNKWVKGGALAYTLLP